MEGNSSKPHCKYGKNCYRTNPFHTAKYRHPPQPVNKDSGSEKVRPPPKRLKVDQGHESPDVDKNVANSSSKPNQISSSDSESDSNIADVSSNSWTYIKTSPKNKPPIKFFDPIVENIKQKSFEGIRDKDKASNMLKELFLVEPSKDMFSFWDLCISLSPDCPLLAFKDVELVLVGPFDLLAGKEIDKELALCYWRYPMDPPEFQTILFSPKEHFGYWRDEACDSQPIVVSAETKDCIISYRGPNIFVAVGNYLKEYLKQCNPFRKIKIAKLSAKLKSWAEKEHFSLSTESQKHNERKKKVASLTFNKFGILVPIDPKTDVGYRPLIETEENLKKLCDIIKNTTETSKKEAALEDIERLVNAANIANDECDFGNGLELGMDLFCSGAEELHKKVIHLLTTSYDLLGRTEWSDVVRNHLKNRNRLIEYFNSFNN